MSEAGRRQRTMRAEKSRKMREFWLANPDATLSEAMEATGCVRSACQNARTKLRKEQKKAAAGEASPATTSTRTSPATPTSSTPSADPPTVGFFDRFPPEPKKQIRKPPAKSEATSSPGEDETPSTETPKPDPKPAPTKQATAPGDKILRLF